MFRTPSSGLEVPGLESQTQHFAQRNHGFFFSRLSKRPGWASRGTNLWSVSAHWREQSGWLVLYLEPKDWAISLAFGWSPLAVSLPPIWSLQTSVFSRSGPDNQLGKPGIFLLRRWRSSHLVPDLTCFARRDPDLQVAATRGAEAPRSRHSSVQSMSRRPAEALTGRRTRCL